MIFAPHADERSAGLALYSIIRRYKVNKGTLLVCPSPVTPAWKTYKRYSIKDINRQFSSNSDTNTPIDIISYFVKKWIKKYKINFLLNIHEGYYKFREKWREYGQSLVIDDKSLIPLCKNALKRINKRISFYNRILIAYKPMESTLTYYLTDMGIKAIGVEVQREIRPMSRKILYQRIIIEELLKEIGVKLIRR